MTAPKPLTERITSLITISDEGCWLWGFKPDRAGYGGISVRGKTQPAHRVSYEVFRGPIPAGLVLDHLCRTPACVNPSHLEPVTNRENILRGTSFSAVNASKTHCHQGHPLSAENLYISGRGYRHCRACNVRRTLAYRARKNAS